MTAAAVGERRQLPPEPSLPDAAKRAWRDAEGYRIWKANRARDAAAARQGPNELLVRAIATEVGREPTWVRAGECEVDGIRFSLDPFGRLVVKLTCVRCHTPAKAERWYAGLAQLGGWLLNGVCCLDCETAPDSEGGAP